jgi:energy-coupling factor transporter ATP-binding protein EcfA2
MGTPAPDILAIIELLLRELRARGVRYCHWKSNEHLDASLRGDTDLDVLFDEAGRDATLAALRAAGFVQCRAAWFRRYRWIEDYVGIDDRTGRVVHVHAHWRLVLGESGVKSFRLPWEERVLASAAAQEASGFPAARPAHELLLLAVRVALKQQFRAGGDVARDRRRAYLVDEQREFNWLRERTDRTELGALARELLGPGAEAPVLGVFDNGLDEAGAGALFAGARDYLLGCRTMGAARAGVHRKIRRLAYRVVAGLNRRTAPRRLPQKRVCIGPGMVIAVVGADGSGKSTLVESVTRELQKKFDVVRLYMGARTESASWLRRRISRRGGGAGRFLANLVLACEKSSRRRYAARCRRRGMFVVMDRYPQCTSPVRNDGPRLSHLARHWCVPLRAVSWWESRRYDQGRPPGPDLLVRLTAAPATLAARRPEVPAATLAEKQESLAKVAYPAFVRVLEIDAGRSREDVFGEVMRAVSWQLRRNAGVETPAAAGAGVPENAEVARA